MTFADITAFIKAFPLLVDAVKNLVQVMQAAAQAKVDQEIRELKGKVTELEKSILLVQTDEKRAELAKQLSDLSRRIK